MNKLIRTYWTATILNILLLSLLYICLPELRPSLRDENKFLENLTAIFYFDSLIISTFFLMRLKPFFWGYIAIPIISLIGFLDEISFGYALLKFKMPKIYGVPIDGVHDILAVSKRMVIQSRSSIEAYLEQNYYDWMVLSLKILGLIIVSTIVFIVVKNKRYLGEKILYIIKNFSPAFFVFMALLYAIMSQIIDEFLAHQFGVDYFLEELLELNASLSFLFASLALRYADNHKIKAKKRAYKL